MINPRVRAVKILQAVIDQKKSLQDCLTSSDTPFIYQLVYGTLRFYHTLSAMANMALQKPLTEKDHDIYYLILLGIYQLQHLNIAEYAVLKETVDGADVLKKSWAKKLINAILRRFLRERECFEKQCLLSEEAQYAHPQWFINKIKNAYPEKWQAILNANNQKAPMHLRVNRLKITCDEYLILLKDAEISAEKNETADSLTLINAMDAEKLPGFSEGLVSVQDIASQKVVDYLDLKPGLSVLDACAAPGGKTSHMLEREPKLGQLMALDISEERIKKIKENLQRLQLDKSNIILLTGDAALPETWLNTGNSTDQIKFDRILLDAPCSATGVIRRHPDIKVLRREKDIQQVVQKQETMLEALWPLVKSQGNLIYTTCSVLPEENEMQIKHFIEKNPEAECVFLHQQLPSEINNADGFFYAVIQKK